MRKKYIIFGTGKASRNFLNNASGEELSQIVCFLDNNKEAQGRTFLGKKIYSPKFINELDYDNIIIASIFFKDIKNQLINLGVVEEKIDTYIDFFSKNFGQYLYFDKTADKLINKDFSLISNSCWALLKYRKLGLKYNSPFIGTLIDKDNYLRLLGNLEYYLSQSLEFNNGENWGSLDDVNIYFPHTQGPEKNIEKWNQRLERFDYENLFVHWGFNYLEDIDINAAKDLDYKNKLFIERDKYYFKNSLEEFISSNEIVDLVKWFNG